MLGLMQVFCSDFVIKDLDDQQGLNLTVLYEVADKSITLQFPLLKNLLKNSKIGIAQFAQEHLVSLFTCIYAPLSAKSLFLDKIFLFILQEGWAAAFFIIGHILSGLSSLLDGENNHKIFLAWKAIFTPPSIVDFILKAHQNLGDFLVHPPSPGITPPQLKSVAAAARTHFEESLTAHHPPSTASQLQKLSRQLNWQNLTSSVCSLQSALEKSNTRPNRATVLSLLQTCGK